MTTESTNKDRHSFDVDKIDAEPDFSSDQDKLEDKRLALEKRKIEADLQTSMQQRAQGVIGKILGGKDHAPIYAISLCVVLLVLASAALSLLGREDPLGIVDMTKTVVFASLGYFAGTRTKSRELLA